MPYPLSIHPVVRRVLPADLARRLAPLATIVSSRAGRSVLTAGGASTNAHLVLEGRVQVAICSIGGGEVVLRDLVAGELFGELAALDGRPRSASIVAVGRCVLASFPGAAFRDEACATPEGALWLARRLAAQVRGLTERVFELATLRVAARLHCELLRLSKADMVDGGRVIDPAPTHAELAARVGAQREAVTRELGWLAGRGVTSQTRRRIHIVDVPALVALARAAKGGECDLFDDAWPDAAFDAPHPSRRPDGALPNLPSA